MTKFNDKEVIEFVKRTHDDFENDTIPEDLIKQMCCYTYKEWCEMIAINNNFLISPLIKKYFDFQQLLQDEWSLSACMGGEEYYLVRLEQGDLKLIDSGDEFNLYYSKCWVVTIPVS